MTDTVTTMNKVMENLLQKIEGFESKAFRFESCLGGPSSLVHVCNIPPASV